MRTAAGWSGLVGLSLLLVTCGGTRSVQLGAQSNSRLDKRYPAVFCKPSRGLAGIGFSPLGAFSSDSSYARATRMACRLLAWSMHVRVKGEKLGGSSFGAGGAKIELLEVPALTPEQCRLDTMDVAGHGWILATSSGVKADFGGKDSFAEERPSWVSKIPDKKGWYYGRGRVEVSYIDEAGSWELAVYHALLDLAFSFARVGGRRMDDDGTLTDAFIVETDVGLQGLCVLKRWRDKRNAYVLVGVPVEGISFYLGSAEDD